jgi:hypothetical protein
MNSREQYSRQIALAEWINETLCGEFPIDDQTRLAFNCFDLAIEHHAAICSLYSLELYGSMYALLRVQFEACGKGLWLRHAATKEYVDKYEKDDLNIGFGKLISIVEKKLGIESSGLSKLKANSWDIFCSFTHTGYQSLVRRSNQTHTGNVNYQDNELASSLQLSGTLAILSTVELASISGNQELVSKALQYAKEYACNSSNNSLKPTPSGAA